MVEAKIYDTGDGRRVETRVTGSRKDLCLETSYLIRSLYDGLMKSSPSDAEFFRGYLSMALQDNLFWRLPMGNGDGCFIDLTKVKRGGQT